MEKLQEIISGCRSKTEMINKLRGPMESERHWYARKSFLLKNWEDWAEEDRVRLECLSQCWSGMHFLGVSYPFQVIEKIREMSFGLPNMSEMLKYADNEIKEAAVERRGSAKKNESNKPTPSPSARLDGGRTGPKSDGTVSVPPALRPSAKQIGLFLTLSSNLRKLAGKADLVKAITMQKQRISFLTEEIVEENLEEMQKYHNRPDLTVADVACEINIMGVFITQAVGTRTQARQDAELAAITLMQKTPVVVVSSHRRKPNGRIVSELCVSNSRGAKTLGSCPPKLKSPEIHVEPH